MSGVALGGGRGQRRRLRLLLAPLVLAAAHLLAAAPAAAAVPRDDAARTALRALGTDRSGGPLIVFGAQRPVPAGTSVTQAGTDRPGGRTVPLTGPARRRATLARAGVEAVRPPAVLRSRRPAWLFYEDATPYAVPQRGGRVVLVDVASGRARVSRTLNWPPLVDGRLPAFLASPSGYADARFRVLERGVPRATPASAARARARPRSTAFDPTDLRGWRAAARALAAERACAVRLPDTLRELYDAQRVAFTRARVGTVLERLAALDRGFRLARYRVTTGRTPAAFLEGLVRRRGCREVLVYVAGGGYRGAEPTVQLGARVVGGALERQDLAIGDLARVVRRHGPGSAAPARFVVLVDAPWSGAAVDRLRREPNVSVAGTASFAPQPSFSAIPGPDGRPGPRNPERMLEYSNRVLSGVVGVLDTPAEVAFGARQRGTTAPSFLAWLFARGIRIRADAPAVAALGAASRLYTSFDVAGPPTARPNRPPVATAGAVTLDEDAPATAFGLTANDPDGDPLRYAVVEGPDHGTLGGRAPALSYRPDRDFAGTDAIRFRVTDPAGRSAEAVVRLTVRARADDPVLAWDARPLDTFTEDGSSVALGRTGDGPPLTATDPDGTTLAGATVTFSPHRAGDGAVAVISGARIRAAGPYADGFLRLTGRAPAAEYERVLRGIRWTTAAQDPGTERTVSVTVTDGADTSNTVSRTIPVVPVDDAPEVVWDADDLPAFTENGDPVGVDARGDSPRLAVTDADDTHLEQATVVLGGALTGDALAATTTGTAITAAYANGTLTLTGADTVAHYEQVLRSVAFDSGSEAPGTSRTLTITVGDGTATSTAVARTLPVTSQNDAPAVAWDADALPAFSEASGTAIGIDAAGDSPRLAVADADDTHLERATVELADGARTGDVLAAETTGTSITATFATGVLTLVGHDTLAHYQQVLRSATFASASEDPGTTRTVGVTVSDGDASSSVMSRTLPVTADNDAPTVAWDTRDLPAFSENGDALYLEAGDDDPRLSVSDPDDTHLDGATVTLTGAVAGDVLAAPPPATPAITVSYANGTLTLSGRETLEAYRDVLRSVSFDSSSDDPGTERTITIRVDDGDDESAPVARRLPVGAVNDPPGVSIDADALATAYVENGPAVAALDDPSDDPRLTVTDPDGSRLRLAVVVIHGAQAGDRLVATTTGTSINAVFGGGMLALEGPDTLANFQQVLRSVVFSTTSEDPGTSRRFEVVASDDDLLDQTAERTLPITPENDAPTVAWDTDALPEFTEDGEAVALDAAGDDPRLTLADADDTHLEGATVTLTGAVDGDVLAAATSGTSVSASYAGGTLTLSGRDTLARYQAVLRSVTFDSESQAPGTERTVAIRVDDGDDESSAASRRLPVQATNDAPVVSWPSGDLPTFSEATGEAVPFDAPGDDPRLTASDPDDETLTSATVTVGGWVDGDRLSVAAAGTGITVSDDADGLFTLNGRASPATFTAVLRSITFSSTSTSPGTSRTVSISVTDDSGPSTRRQRTLPVTPANDAPVVTLDRDDLPTDATEDGPAVAALDDPADDTRLTADDADDTNLESATVTVVGAEDGDLLEATTTGTSIQATAGAGDGVLELSGTATLADYGQVLRSVVFSTTAQDPSASREIRVTVSDGDDDSAAVGRALRVTAMDDGPVVDWPSSDLPTFSEATGEPVPFDAPGDDPRLTVSDADGDDLVFAKVMVADWVDGDSLDVDTAGTGITVADNGRGRLTLTGSASPASYTTVLRSITFDSTSTSPGRSRTVGIEVSDGSYSSGQRSRTIPVVALPDPPAPD